MPWNRRIWLRLVVVFGVVLLALATVASPANAFTVKGAIKVEYDRLGGARTMGQPNFDERDALDGGKFQEFSLGSSIYWHQTRTGGNLARQVGGAIRDKWASQNYERGWLGYPTTSETATRKPGRFNHFQYGSIYWSSATGAHTVTGEIYQAWAAYDWENGSYGFPTSDDYAFEGGRKQDFQGGSLVYRPGGFVEDWTGDEDGTDVTPECGQVNSSCSNDGRDLFRIQYQDLTTQPPLGTPLPAGRSAQAPIAQCPAGITAGSEPDEPTPSAPETAPSTTTPETTTTTTPSTTTPGTTTTTTPSTTTPGTTTTTTPADLGAVTWCKAPIDTSSGTTSTGRVGIQSTVPGTLNCENKEVTWRGSTTGACYLDSDATYVMVDTRGNVKGRVVGIESMNVNPNWNNTEVFVEYAFEVVELSQGAEVGAKMTLSQSCTSRVNNGSAQACGGTGDTTEATLTEGSTVSSISSFFPAVDPTPSNMVTLQPTTSITLQASGAANVSNAQAAHPPLRCDAEPRMRNTKGCKVAEVRPVWDLTQAGSGLNEYIKHVAMGQRSGLPGYGDLAGNGTTLRRITDKAEIDKRRNITCGGVVGTGPNGGRPVGKSCDEYPMASTYEGGGSGGTQPGVARTFPVAICGIKDNNVTTLTDPPPNRGSGYSVCMIDAGQNSRAGSLLGWFYTKNRVIAGDVYHVHPG